MSPNCTVSGVDSEHVRLWICMRLCVSRRWLWSYCPLHTRHYGAPLQVLVAMRQDETMPSSFTAAVSQSVSQSWSGRPLSSATPVVRIITSVVAISHNQSLLWTVTSQHTALQAACEASITSLFTYRIASSLRNVVKRRICYYIVCPPLIRGSRLNDSKYRNMLRK